jgi:hypothetical protein
MHAQHEYFLVVRAIEDADPAALGKVAVAAPEIVVIEFFCRRRLERHHLATLRIDSGHDVLDGAVLAGCIHGLEDQQQRPTILRVQHALKFGEPFDAGLQHLPGARLVFLL